MKNSILVGTGLALLLTACGSATTSGNAQRPVTAGMRPATNDHRGTASPIANPTAAQAGDLLGRDRAALVALFGNPRLEGQDGGATRLQFASDRCVLDAYLYARSQGAQPTVTHVDARTPDGADANRGDCISALRRR